MKERSQPFRCLAGLLERAVHRAFQLQNVAGHVVGQVGVLGMVPHMLHRVESRRVRRKPLESESPARLKAAGRLAMHRPAVQHHDQGPSQMPLHVPQETLELLGGDISTLDAEVQPQPVSACGQAQATDHAEAVVSIPAVHHRRLPHWSPGSPYHRSS